MQSILIGIAVLVVCICALLYYKLKKVNEEVLRLNKKLESITASKPEVIYLIIYQQPIVLITLKLNMITMFRVIISKMFLKKNQLVMKLKKKLMN